MVWTEVWSAFELPVIVLTITAVSYLCAMNITAEQTSKRNGKPKVPHRGQSILSALTNTFELIFRAREFMSSTIQHNGKFVPNRAPLLIGDIYIIRGPESLETLWKISGQSSSTEVHRFFFGLIFGMPKKAQLLYANDDSGFVSKPHPASKVQPSGRIDYITHQVLKEFLQSEASISLAPRFTAKIENRFAHVHIGDTWMEKEDLLGFLEMELFRANIEASYGSIIFDVHPGFCEDFWYFSHHLYGFYRPLPRLTIHKAYAARARLLASLKEWQKRILEKDISDDDAYWGSEKVRTWHARFLTLDGFDEDAIASLYLGIIWVSNYNFIISIFWMVLDTYQRPLLLDTVREPLSEVSSQIIGNDPSLFPLIESIYAETLRLRTEAYITRRFPHGPVNLDGKWTIPQNKVCLASTHPAHHDAGIWNTYQGLHPLDTFWAERFLIKSDDLFSGPLDPTYRDSLPSKQKSLNLHPSHPCSRKTQEGQFSLHGLSAAWIPYGGGPRACPGRHIAKKQILSCYVSILQRFEIEINSGEYNWQMDAKSYGPGVQLPVGKVAFRIRRRKQ